MSFKIKQSKITKKLNTLNNIIKPCKQNILKIWLSFHKAILNTKQGKNINSVSNS